MSEHAIDYQSQEAGPQIGQISGCDLLCRRQSAPRERTCSSLCACADRVPVGWQPAWVGDDGPGLNPGMPRDHARNRTGPIGSVSPVRHQSGRPGRETLRKNLANGQRLTGVLLACGHGSDTRAHRPNSVTASQAGSPPGVRQEQAPKCDTHFLPLYSVSTPIENSPPPRIPDSTFRLVCAR
jgi:hypothetical protein